MSRHSFDPKVAELVGVNAAVIYQNLLWWCEKNAANSENIRDGRAWTYNSLPAFSKLFPYFTERQIRTALEKLENAGLILVGEYNKERRDRTKWYSATSLSLFASDGNVGASDQNVRASDKKVRPLPDSKPDNKPDTSRECANDLFSANEEQQSQAETLGSDVIEEGFNEFWKNVWPKHFRKEQKATCEKVYRTICLGKFKDKEKKAYKKVSPADLNRCAQLYIATVRDRQYLKAPLAWLRKPGWASFLEGMHNPEPMRYEDLEYYQQCMIDQGMKKLEDFKRPDPNFLRYEDLEYSQKMAIDHGLRSLEYYQQKAAAQ